MKKITKKNFLIPAKDKAKYLNDFKNIYKKRPIQKNIGGMPIINLFNLYSVIRSLKPKIIVESGTFKGQSSWFILKAAPKAKIYCFDIDLTQLIYKSNKIRYIEGDIKNYNFYNIKEKSILILDDHQNQIERLKQSVLFGFDYVFLDDNSDNKNHDFYTLQHLLKKINFNHNQKIKSIFKTMYIFLFLMVDKIFKNSNSYSLLKSRLKDFKFKKNNLEFLNSYIVKIYDFHIHKYYFKKKFYADFKSEKKNGKYQNLIKLKKFNKN